LFAESIKSIASRQLVIPNATRWNSTFDACQCLNNLGADTLGKLCNEVGLTRFSAGDLKFLREFVMVSWFYM
jgi:hypothetical protein